MPTKSIITVDFFAVVVVCGSPFEFKFIVRLGLVQDYIIVCTVGWVGWGVKSSCIRISFYNKINNNHPCTERLLLLFAGRLD